MCLMVSKRVDTVCLMVSKSDETVCLMVSKRNDPVCLIQLQFSTRGYANILTVRTFTIVDTIHDCSTAEYCCSHVLCGRIKRQRLSQ